MKARTFFSVSAAIALLASCTAEQVENAPQEKGGKVYLEVTAAQPSTPETRLAYTENTGGTHVGMTAAWEASEQLGVISYSGTAAEGDFAASAPSATTNILTGGAAGGLSTTFTGDVTASIGLYEGKYNFYRPVHTEGSTISTLGSNYIEYDYTGQCNTLEEINATTYVGDPAALSDYDVLYTSSPENPTEGGITLIRRSAILRFVLTLPAGAPAIDRIELSASAAVFYEKLKLTFNNIGNVLFSNSSQVNTIGLDVSGDNTDGNARTITAYMLTPSGSGLNAITIPMGTVTVSAIAADGTTYAKELEHFKTDPATLVRGETYSFVATLALVTPPAP
jgi:hypothetical protein